MGNGFQPEAWRDVFVMLGTASAALIGLLFIVTSLHLDEIVNNSVYRIRARNNTFYLFSMLVEATLIIIPQPMAILGLELIIVVLFLLLLHLRHFYKFNYKSKDLGARGGFTPYATLRFVSSDILGIAGGLCLVQLSNWGLYLITASYVVFLGSVILNAWKMLLGVGQAEKITKAKRGTARRFR